METKFEEIKTKDLIKEIYKGYNHGSILLNKAVKDGILTRVRIGVYLKDKKAQEWIKKMRGEL